MPHYDIEYENYGKTLVINKVDFDDEGEYTCEASNGVGVGKHHSVNLKVHQTPYLTKEPINQIAAKGEDVVIECRAGGYPAPIIQWTYNGKPIRDSSLNPRRSVSKNMIIIRNLTTQDTGNYGCNATTDHSYIYKDVFVNVSELPPKIVTLPEASNKHGQDNAGKHLAVKQKTIITKRPISSEVLPGATAVFHCNARGDPDLDMKITWLKYEDVIQTDSEPRVVQGSDNSLTITNTTEEDTGIYTCLAVTELDEARASAELVVHQENEELEAPLNFVLQEVLDSRSAIVSWEPVGQFVNHTGYHVQYFSWTDQDKYREINVPVDVTSALLPSLTPNALYFARVWAVSGVYKGPPSNTISFTTPEGPPGPVDHLECFGGDLSSALLISWTPPTKVNGILTGYRIYYSQLKGKTVGPKIGGEPIIGPDEGTTTTLEGLEPQSRYRVTVTATTQGGEGQGFYADCDTN